MPCEAWLLLHCIIILTGLEALKCHLIPKSVLYLYKPLLIINSNKLVMSRGNWKNFTYAFLQKAGCYKANLLSISQFCDNDLVVQFSKKECNIFDSSGKWLMGGERTADNCYGLPGLTTYPQIFCNKTTIDDSELWHQRLGHLNFTNMLKIAGKDIVKDLPKMEKTGKGICGSCQLGKQTRAAHRKT
jgi:hypothetical protein